MRSPNVPRNVPCMGPTRHCSTATRRRLVPDVTQTLHTDFHHTHGIHHTNDSGVQHYGSINANTKYVEIHCSVDSANTLPVLQKRYALALRQTLLMLWLTHKGLVKRYKYLYNSISLSRNSPSNINAILFSNIMNVEIKM